MGYKRAHWTPWRCGPQVSDYIHSCTRGSRALEPNMARSTNILLACMAMLGAMLLAVVMTPHNLMAYTHDVFDIDKHLPTKFGDWKPVEGLNVIAPPAADSLEAAVYNQEASRGFVDPEGHVVMLMVAYGESQSDSLQLHHPEVCYTAQGFRVSRTSPLKLDYASSAPPLKATRLVAQREERVEPITYWMRIGYDNSSSNWARQALKLGTMPPRRRRSRRPGSWPSARSGLSPSPTGCGSATTIRAAIGPGRHSSLVTASGDGSRMARSSGCRRLAFRPK